MLLSESGEMRLVPHEPGAEKARVLAERCSLFAASYEAPFTVGLEKEAHARSDFLGQPGPKKKRDTLPRPEPMPLVTLKPGHVQPVWSGHPWVFAQAIAHVE